MRSDKMTAMRIFGWGMVAMLVLAAGVQWLKKDPLSDIDLENRVAMTMVAPDAAEPTPELTALPAPATGGPMMGGPMVGLPAAVQTRVERITQSEILGPVMRPLPMALLGIAGEDAFMRTPMGQTGLMRVGEELGGVRLLRIGTNRVLIAHAGEQKELTLHAGFGGESLVSGGTTGSVAGIPAGVGQ